MSKIVLRTKSGKSKGKKLIGAYLPLSLTQYLHLHCMAHEKSISTIVEEILIQWVSDQQHDTEQLTEMVTNRALKLYKEVDTDKLKKKFIAALSDQLTRKGISQKTIDEILKGLSYGKNKASND